MKDNTPEILTMVFFVGLITSVLVLFMLRQDLLILKKQAVELKHAEYNSQTGEWQWITNR